MKVVLTLFTLKNPLPTKLNVIILRISGRYWQRQVVIKWKPLLVFIKGNKPQLPDYLSDLVFSQRADKLLHTWQQGSAEAEHAIKILTAESQIVLDPFLGAGTTAVCAIKLQRRFIGIDIDPNALDSVRANLRLTK